MGERGTCGKGEEFLALFLVFRALTYGPVYDGEAKFHLKFSPIRVMDTLFTIKTDYLLGQVTVVTIGVFTFKFCSTSLMSTLSCRVNLMKETVLGYMA